MLEASQQVGVSAMSGLGTGLTMILFSGAMFWAAFRIRDRSLAWNSKGAVLDVLVVLALGTLAFGSALTIRALV